MFVYNYFMVKSKFALFIDSFFISSSISFLIYLWLNNKIKNANLFKYFLILILILLFLLIYNLFKKQHDKKIFKNLNEKFLQNCLNELISSSNKEYINFICKLLNCKHIENFLFKFEDRILYINIKTELTASDYFLVQESLINNSLTTTKLYFIYKSKNKSFDDISSLSKFEIVLFEADILLKIMSLKNIFPITKEESKKLSFKTKLINNLKSKTNNITSKHFKEFFFSGLSLLFLSLIVPFSNYYLITGSILLIISIISLFRKNFKPNKNDSNFLLDNKKEQL